MRRYTNKTVEKTKEIEKREIQTNKEKKEKRESEEEEEENQR